MSSQFWLLQPVRTRASSESTAHPREYHSDSSDGSVVADGDGAAVMLALTEADTETLGEMDAEAEAESETLAVIEAEADAETDALPVMDGRAEMDSLADTEADADGRAVLAGSTSVVVTVRGVHDGKPVMLYV